MCFSRCRWLPEPFALSAGPGSAACNHNHDLWTQLICMSETDFYYMQSEQHTAERVIKTTHTCAELARKTLEWNMKICFPLNCTVALKPESTHSVCVCVRVCVALSVINDLSETCIKLICAWSPVLPYVHITRLGALLRGHRTKH